MKRDELLSAALMAAGTVGLYLANLVFAKLLSPEAYGHFGLVLSLPALAYSFGLFGAEQVLLRHGRPEGARLRLPGSLGRVELAAGLASTLLLAAFFAWKYRLPGWGAAESMIGYSLLAGGSAALLHEVSVLRLARSFGMSQLGAQGWRIALPATALLLAWRGASSAGWAGGALMVLIPASGLLAFILRRTAGIELLRDEGGLGARAVWTEAFLFSSSLLSLSLLAQMDRLVLAKSLSVESAGVYVFLLVISTGPFTLIQSYMGFTLLPKLRHREDGESRAGILRRAGLETAALSVLATGASLALYYLLVRRHYDAAYRRDAVFLVLLALGWIRAYYGIVSARLSAAARLDLLGRSAAYGWILSGLAIPAAWWIGGRGLAAMSLLVLVLWTLRALAWWRLALRAEASE